MTLATQHSDLPALQYDNSPNLDQNPAAIYLASLTKGSRRVQQSALNKLAGLFPGGFDAFSFPWQALRYPHCTAIRTRLAELDYAPQTANRYLSALKGVLREAWRLELMSDRDYHRAIDLKSIKGQKLPAGRALSKEEIAQLLQACLEDESPTGSRDAAMLGILRSGLRRSEVVGLDIGDLNPSDGALRIRGAKGNKDRIAYLSPKGLELVSGWLKVRGWKDGPLLLRVSQTKKLIWERLSDQAVYWLLSKRAKQAEIGELSPHDFRRTFAGDLLDNSVDLPTVQKLMGHASHTTTARYDRRGEDTKRRAVQGLDL